ncbi:hypothetical protein [Sphingobium sp.]|uniref:hypothetical protein n=1 Tax=Sphingobium sp. TaxID=1912891 RepID=UPI00257BA968|nr:hypothetical protein [Sphingobium sp.]
MKNEWLDAYQNPYDPCPAIKAWGESDAEVAIKELWERLFHQGTIGTASYRAVPELVHLIEASVQPDWNSYALIASIEEARLGPDSPSMPMELDDGYARAWENLLPFALRDLSSANDDPLVRSLIAVIAHAKKQHSLAVIALCTEDERQDMLGMDS